MNRKFSGNGSLLLRPCLVQTNCCRNAKYSIHCYWIFFINEISISNLFNNNENSHWKLTKVNDYGSQRCDYQFNFLQDHINSITMCCVEILHEPVSTVISSCSLEEKSAQNRTYVSGGIFLFHSQCQCV